MSRETTAPTRTTGSQDSGLSILKDNLEAIAIAIVMALVIRHFCVEAFEIPTRSMEPTLWGAEDHGGIGDRILVDKSAYLFTGPNRWDVVVFRYPLDRSRNFIKRLVGLPGERLRIGSDGGSVWIKMRGQDTYQTARKPRRVRESLYHAVYPPDPSVILGEVKRTDHDFGQRGDGLWAFWETDDAEREAWNLDDGATLRFTGGDKSTLESRNSITTTSTPRSWHYSRDSSTRVRDVRIAGTLTAGTAPKTKGPAEPLPETELRLVWKPDERLEYGLVLRSPGSELSEAYIKRDGTVFQEGRLPVQLTAGKAVRFELEAVDGDLRVHINDTEVLVRPDERTIDDTSSSNVQQLRFDARGAALTVADLRIDRDLVYGNSWNYVDSAQDGVLIPDGHYFMLGDNTGSSSDSRKWSVHTVRLKDGTKIEHDSNPGPNNPMSREYDEERGCDLNGIRDIYGVRRKWYEDDEVGGPAVRYAPFVVRDLIVGRAFLIFWPLFPDFPHRLRFIR